MIKNEQKVEYSGELSERQIELNAPSLEDLGPAGQKTLEIMRALSQVIQNLGESTSEINLATTMMNGSFSYKFELKSTVDHNPQPKNLVLGKRIGDLGLSVRLINVLEAEGITDIAGVLSKSWEEFSQMKNCGATTMKEISDKILNPYSLALKNNPSSALHDWVATQQVLKRPISAFNVSKRLCRALECLGVTTVKQLTEHVYDEVKDAKNIGPRSMEMLEKEILRPHNLRLKQRLKL